MFPVATLYTGEGRTCLGAGKIVTSQVAVVDALVPKGALRALTENVVPVCTIITPDITFMSDCATLPIPWPPGYPSTDITRVYKPGGKRASVASAGGRLHSFNEHWAAQQEADR